MSKPEIHPLFDTKYEPCKRDSHQMRQVFGIAHFSKIEDQLNTHQTPLPNCLIHEADATEYSHEGGTNGLVVGEKGSGKSTLALWLSTHLMSMNDEAIIWRGSEDRSEWLPFRSWTTLMLPAGVDADPRWKPRDIRMDNGGEPVELEDVVRDVVYYDGIEDLLSKLEPHQFHVVYPDPEFRGCNDVVEESGYFPHDVEYIPQSHTGDEKPTPVVHWWFAFFAGRLEYGPYDWTSVIFDEVADLAPDSARADRAETYEKVVSMRKVMADSRKYHLSFFAFGHHEENLHSKVRRTIQWRFNMPDGTANPCEKNGDSPPVGFNQLPMRADMLSRANIGNGICWTETNFTPFTWDDIPVAPCDDARWLKINLDSSKTADDTHARVSDSTEDPVGVSDD